MRSNPVRILLVEDHEDTLAMMRRLLRQNGYQITTATTMTEALRLGEAGDFDILLTDLQLADGWGWTLVERLRERRPHFRAVAVTGHAMKQHLLRSADAGFCAHLTKPIDLKTLLETIEHCVSLAGGGTPGSPAPSSPAV